MPLFSVVIPTYNRAGLLRTTLQSIFAQSFDDYEVIVVDDGSTDDTVEYLASLEPNVRVLSQMNKGPGSARNLGAAHATGDYLAFLDSDDLWFPWSLGTYAQVVTRFDHPAFIAGRPCRFQETSELNACENRPFITNAFSDYLASGSEWRWWSASSFVIHRSAYLKSGGSIDLHVNAEDADLALRLGTSGTFVQVVEPVTFGYREHPQSAMKNFAATVAGSWNLIRQERSGSYPGGRSRRTDRWTILTRHLRPTAIGCLAHGMRAHGWWLYFAMIRWHIALGRWRFLMAFPWLFIVSFFRKRKSSSKGNPVN